MNKWETNSLESTGELFTGFPFKSKNYTDKGKYKVIRGENIKEKHILWGNKQKCWNKLTKELEPYLLKHKDIVIGMDGSKIGLNRAMINQDDLPSLLAQRTTCLRTNENFDQEFIKYQIFSDDFKAYVDSVKTGSSIPHISLQQIKEFKFKSPSLNKQKKIGTFLSNIDKKIWINKRDNEILNNFAKTLFDYWFLQFDYPNLEKKPYKQSQGEMYYHKDLKREIPISWSLGNLNDIAEYINGLACQKYRPKNNENKIPVVKIKEMHEGITERTEYVKESIDNKYIINDGDILFSWSGTLETMIWTGGKSGLNQHIFKVNPKYPKYYVYLQLSAYLINFVKMAESRKTTMGHITKDHLIQSRIPLPPLEITQKFNKHVEKIFNKIIQNEIENRKLKTMRDFLMHPLLHGTITFKD